MMIDALFSDELVSATELRTHQKRWLDKASRTPVTISSGSKRLVILDREYVGRLHALKTYGRMVIEFCSEQTSKRGIVSKVFPWTVHLSEEALAEFREELFATYGFVARDGDVRAIDEMLDGWAATAEILSNPELVELLTDDVNGEEFTTVE